MAAELNWSDTDEKSAVETYVRKINHFLEEAGLEPEASSGAMAARVPAV